MAKKPTPLSFRDIVLGADVETIRRALEARQQIDTLIQERQAAYERIAALESQVEDVLGEPGSFPFPAPPLPVAGFDPKAESVNRGAAPAPARKAAPKSTSTNDTDDDANESGDDANA